VNIKKGPDDYRNESINSSLKDRELIKRLWGYIRSFRILIFITVFFLICVKIIEAIIPIYIGKLSQIIIDHIGVVGNTDTEILGRILKTGFLLILLLFFGYLFDSCNVLLRSWIGQKGLYVLRTRIYEHVMTMPLAYFDRNTVGRLMTRTIHDVDQINQMLTESLIPIIGNIFLFIGIFLGIVIIDWRVAILTTLILPIVWWLTQRFRKEQRVCYDRVRTVSAALNTFIQEHLMGASIIRNFGLQSQTKKEFEKINEDYCKAYQNSIHNFSFFLASIDFLQNLSLILAFMVIVIFAPFGSNFQIGIFLTFSIYVIMFFRPLGDLAERYNVLQSAISAAARIFNLLDQDTEKKTDTGKVELTEIQTIAFEDVWFYYEKDNWVFKGLSVNIHKGNSYAIVGVTGEGKSTLISLLLRFYEPQKGRILINGQNIQEYTLNSLRKQFSLVLQDPVIFSGTIKDNISFFDDSISKDYINHVVNYLGMESLIEDYSEGLDRPLQSQGKGLSTGEMQLISLARAIAHRRSVLILDEATASVDVTTEQMMQNAVHTVLKGQTALIVAHRLSTIKDVSKIIVLQGGKVVEMGSHSMLLEKKGIYEKLYRLQFMG
jgi:ATP-binding cassette subfamily B multidrug efflux pump